MNNNPNEQLLPEPIIINNMNGEPCLTVIPGTTAAEQLPSSMIDTEINSQKCEECNIKSYELANKPVFMRGKKTAGNITSQNNDMISPQHIFSIENDYFNLEYNKRRYKIVFSLSPLFIHHGHIDYLKSICKMFDSINSDDSDDSDDSDIELVIEGDPAVAVLIALEVLNEKIIHVGRRLRGLNKIVIQQVVSPERSTNDSETLREELTSLNDSYPVTKNYEYGEQISSLIVNGERIF